MTGTRRPAGCLRSEIELVSTFLNVIPPYDNSDKHCLDRHAVRNSGKSLSMSKDTHNTARLGAQSISFITDTRGAWV